MTLHLDAKSSAPTKTQRAIRTAIDAIVRGKRKAGSRELTDLAVNLGCLWGQCVCDAAGWEWCYAKLGRHAILMIASPSRAHVIAPMHFVQSQLTKRPPEDNTSLLLFNMIVAGKLPAAPRGAYLHVG